MVVRTSLCPSTCWSVRMSQPPRSASVAKEWRKVWQVARFVA